MNNFKRIKKLKVLYKDNSLTSLIVYTQSFFKEYFIAMKNYLITKIDNQLIILNVLAKMKKMESSIIKSYSLEELLTKTKNLIEENSNLVLLSTAKSNTEKKMEDLINEKIKISNEISFNQIIENTIYSYLGNFIKQEIKKFNSIFLFSI